MNKETLIKRSAWVLGPIASWLIPTLSAPLEPETFPFFWAGCGAVLIGFLAERLREADYLFSGVAKSKVFVSAAAIFLIFGIIHLVLLGQINTPSKLQEGIEFFFFVGSALGGGYLMSLAHRHGADFIIEKYS